MDDQNIRELYENKISFLSLMKEDRRIYKQMVDKHLAALESKENLVEYNGRYVYIVRDECEIVEGYKAYIYVCRDITMRGLESSKLFANARWKNMSTSDVYDAMKSQGIFILFSSRPISKEKLLGTYYMRSQIEQIFDIVKNYNNLLPPRVETEETFRGHLVLAFIASVVVRMLNIDLKKTDYTVESALLNLRNQKCKVFEREVLPQESIKKINDLYKQFKLTCPNSIPRKKTEIHEI